MSIARHVTLRSPSEGKKNAAEKQVNNNIGVIEVVGLKIPVSTKFSK